MTVGELIAELQSYNKDLEVSVYDGFGEYHEILDVDEVTENDDDFDIVDHSIRIAIDD